MKPNQRIQLVSEEMLDEPLVEEDPSRVPILWPEDEDFMQKKFRR